MSDLKRWRGLKDLVSDAMQHGTSAVERVHLETARRPFAVLERIAGLSEPVQGIRQLHDAVVTTSYGAVRAVAQAVDTALGVALDALEAEADTNPTANDDGSSPPPTQP